MPNKTLAIISIIAPPIREEICAKDISSMLKEAYGRRVRIFANVIPISVRAAEISAEGVSIYKHDPEGKVASAYDSLTKEVLADGQ